MLWHPGSPGSVRVISNSGIVGTSTPWTGVPSNATTLLYGAVTELISASSNTMDSWGIGIVITATGTSNTASEASLDILVGGDTDDVLIKALLCGYKGAAGTTVGTGYYYFPVHVPGGLRVAAQLASVRTSITAQVGVYLYGDGVPPHRVARKVTTYGTQINNARGQAVVPAASGGTASVTEMTASSTEDHFYLMPGFQVATDSIVSNSGCVNIGIGIGASTEERVGTWWWHKDTNENLGGPVPPMGGIGVFPSGSRLTILASNTSTNDAAYDGLIYAC